MKRVDHLMIPCSVYSLWGTWHWPLTEDAVTQTQPAASGMEGGSVALGCTYEMDASYYSLYWYKQHGAEKFVFLLWGYSCGLKKNEAGKRFSADFKKSESLRITGLELRDSAMYFCERASS
uniref:Ig-like domain-containing protein n=1 Tax=Chelonoidis abingdonii TaxID=106734 RepID=A0A8C0GZ09_CHEAB